MYGVAGGVRIGCFSGSGAVNLHCCGLFGWGNCSRDWSMLQCCSFSCGFSPGFEVNAAPYCGLGGCLEVGRHCGMCINVARKELKAEVGGISVGTFGSFRLVRTEVARACFSWMEVMDFATGSARRSRWNAQCNCNKLVACETGGSISSMGNAEDEQQQTCAHQLVTGAQNLSLVAETTQEVPVTTAMKEAETFVGSGRGEVLPMENVQVEDGVNVELELTQSSDKHDSLGTHDLDHSRALPECVFECENHVANPLVSSSMAREHSVRGSNSDFKTNANDGNGYLLEYALPLPDANGGSPTTSSNNFSDRMANMVSMQAESVASTTTHRLSEASASQGGLTIKQQRSNSFKSSQLANGFWQVLENDVQFVARGLKWAKELATTSLAERVGNIISLRHWEDPAAVSPPSIPWCRPCYPGLSGVDLILADFNTLKQYMDHIRGWFAIWQVPLQLAYEPEVILGYFIRRPHVMAFRIFEVFAAISFVIIRLEVEKLIMRNIRSGKWSDGDDHELRLKRAEMLKEALLQLGPTFIKVGQSLSTRPDLVGPETAEVLAELQDSLPSFPAHEAFIVIEEELGRPVSEIFSSISENAVAAASFGQVYRGRTVCGQDVAVKVQRPNLLYSVALDVCILRLLLEFLQKLFKRQSNWKLYADEIGKGLYGELDYMLEAANAADFQVNKGMEASLVQILDTGLLHADPHPGNLLYTPDGRMVFLDFGLICRMEREHQLAMLAAVAHIVNADWKGFVNDLADMDVLPPEIDRFTIYMEIENSLGDMVPVDGLPNVKFTKVFSIIVRIAARHQFKMPGYFILVLRSIASLEGLALAVDPDFKVFALSYPYVVQRLLTDKSMAARDVLASLVLNEKKEFQWDRLASFAILAHQQSLKRSALESGFELQEMPPSNYKAQGTNPEMLVQLLSLLISKDGTSLRRLVLTADTYALARAFVSNKAALLRRHAARIIANVIYQWWKEALQNHLNILGQDFTESTAALSSDGMDGPNIGIPMQQIRNYVTNEMKLLANSSTQASGSLLKNRHLRFLFQAVFARLKRAPLLMMMVGWTSLSVFFHAFATACHRLFVALAFKLLDSDSQLLRAEGFS
eukprot:c28292_g1_i1 orf=189-3473(+)